MNVEQKLKDIYKEFNELKFKHEILDKSMMLLGFNRFDPTNIIPEGRIEIIGQGSYYEGDGAYGLLKDINSDGKGQFSSRFDDISIMFWRKEQ